jgi:phospholipase/carboxylesterase
MPITLSGPELAPASGSVKKLVIFLHGYGSNGDDLIGLAPLMRDALPDAHFLSPNAPAPCGMGGPGFEWFQLMDRSALATLTGTQEAGPILDAYITAQRDRFNLTDVDIALVGFSQGTMMALHVAPRREQTLAGVVGFSGMLSGGADGMRSKPPICLIHGKMDDVVPFDAMAMAELTLREAGLSVETHARPYLPHSIDPEGIEIANAFLQKQFS